jgi:hypothetical protein
MKKRLLSTVAVASLVAFMTLGAGPVQALDLKEVVSNLKEIVGDKVREAKEARETKEDAPDTYRPDIVYFRATTEKRVEFNGEDKKKDESPTYTRTTTAQTDQKSYRKKGDVQRQLQVQEGQLGRHSERDPEHQQEPQQAEQQAEQDRVQPPIQQRQQQERRQPQPQPLKLRLSLALLCGISSGRLAGRCMPVPGRRSAGPATACIPSR